MKKWNSVRWRKNIFCTEPTRAAKAGQKSLVPASPANQPRKSPFHMYSLSLHLLQFQQSAGATPLYSLSGHAVSFVSPYCFGIEATTYMCYAICILKVFVTSVFAYVTHFQIFEECLDSNPKSCSYMSDKYRNNLAMPPSFSLIHSSFSLSHPPLYLIYPTPLTNPPRPLSLCHPPFLT
jgi:hypothetical protein